MKHVTVGHRILTHEGLKKGFLGIDGEDYAEISWGDPPPGTPRALILPAFVNAHSHIGDSAAYPAPKGSVKEIVGPPDGFKHRMLRSRTSAEKVDAMKQAVQVMRASGTALFADFREEGVEGLNALRSVESDDWPRALVLSRPSNLKATRDEITALLSSSDGLGLSAISDWNADDLSLMSREARKAGKLFAIHASEAVREDIDAILDLKPSFLVHMCRAADDDIVACRDANIPIVVCPNSNHFFGLDPHIPGLLRAGLSVALGTDNGMIVRPDILAELKAAYAISSAEAKVEPMEIVRLATFGGRKVLNVDAKITTEISGNTELLVIRTSGDDPLGDLVTRSRSEDIIATVRGGKVRRTSAWTT